MAEEDQGSSASGETESHTDTPEGGTPKVGDVESGDAGQAVPLAETATQGGGDGADKEGDPEQQREEGPESGEVGQSGERCLEGPSGGFPADQGPVGQPSVDAPGGSEIAGQGVQDLLAELQMERDKYGEQMKVEARAREELEDMLLRMERHFKTEQAARKEAEEMLEQAAQAEIAAKNQMEDAAQKHAADEKRVQDELEAIQKERKGLETMRQEFESEVQAARVEVKKAQEALKTAEERVRADERVQKAKMEAEYQTRIIALGSELERVREELAIRTQSLGDELERWRKQAELAAVAVIEAKGEVMERRREIDVTKDRMDRLVDKLYAGREHGIVLHGALQAAQMYHGQAQARLLASMQKSYYHGVQAGLPWGGTIAGAGAKQLPAPALEEQGGEARRWGKGKAEGRGPRALGNRLPPLSARGPQGGGLQGEYPAVPSRYAQRATAQAQAQGAQAKRQQRLARQRSKDRFAGQRDRAFAVMSRWD